MCVLKFRNTSNSAIFKILMRKPRAALKAYQGYLDWGRENYGKKGSLIYLEGVSKFVSNKIDLL